MVKIVGRRLVRLNAKMGMFMYMCKDEKYKEYLHCAVCEINELFHLTMLFYPETSAPNKISGFDINNFIDACDKAIISLEKLNKLHKKKNYTDEHLAENIYCALDEKWHYIYNTQVIIGTISRKKDQLSKVIDKVTEYTDLSIAGDFLAFNDILIDVSTFLIRFANWKNIDTNSWPMACMKKRVSPCEVFMSSIYISKRAVYLNDYSIPPLAIFLLRQAIELKICEILNIFIVVDENENVIKITGDKFLPLLTENYFILPVRKSVLEKIHKWANGYVHLGSIDYLWKVEFAQFYLMNFLMSNISAFVLKPYYENKMYEDIKTIVNGYFQIIPFKEKSNSIKLLELDIFTKTKQTVNEIGYKKFIENKDNEYKDELMRRVN